VHSRFCILQNHISANSNAPLHFNSPTLTPRNLKPAAGSAFASYPELPILTWQENLQALPGKEAQHLAKLSFYLAVGESELSESELLRLNLIN